MRQSGHAREAAYSLAPEMLRTPCQRPSRGRRRRGSDRPRLSPYAVVQRHMIASARRRGTNSACRQRISDSNPRSGGGTSKERVDGRVKGVAVHPNGRFLVDPTVRRRGHEGRFRVDLSRRMEFGRMTVFSVFRILMVPGRTAAIHFLCSRSLSGEITPDGRLCAGYPVAEMIESFDLWP